jgi:hypothetical protein
MAFVAPVAIYVTALVAAAGPDLIRTMLVDQSVVRALQYPRTRNPWFF